MRTRRALLRICSISCLCALLVQTAPADAAPQVEASLAAETVSTGQSFSVVLNISWRGEADRYLIEPPLPELPDGIEHISSSFASYSQEDLQRLQYTFILRAAADGPYTIKPLSITYRPRGDEQAGTVLSPEISFTAARFPLLRNNQGIVLIAGAAALIAAASAGIFYIRRKRARKKSAEPDGAGETRVASLLQACRTCKIRGDYAGFYEAALACRRLLPQQDGPRCDELAARLETIRFGGAKPSAEELERQLRQLEKTASGIRAAAEDQAREYQKYCR